MAVTVNIYGDGFKKFFEGEINWTTTDNIKVALLTNAYIPNQDTHNNFTAHCQANEISGTGYTDGGTLLANCSISYDGATNKIKLDSDDINWTSSTITSQYAVIYTVGGTLLGYVDFGEDKTSSNGDFQILWNANGIFEIVVV